MAKTITVIFDGENLKPSVPEDLEPDRSYQVTIEELPPQPAAGDAWSELSALAGTIEAPPDWAAQHDHYLYGSPKRAR
jgi:hypothetical protein